MRGRLVGETVAAVPNVAYWLETDRRQVVSACQPFTAKGDIWNAPRQLRLVERQRR